LPSDWPPKFGHPGGLAGAVARQHVELEAIAFRQVDLDYEARSAKVLGVRQVVDVHAGIVGRRRRPLRAIYRPRSFMRRRGGVALTIVSEPEN
jgi:hypothetical protein